MNSSDKAATAGVKILFFIAAWFGVLALWAYALHVLWAWFIVPTFALPAITFWQAWGLKTTLAIASSHGAIPKETAGYGHSMGVLVAVPLVALCIGWFIKQML